MDDVFEPIPQSHIQQNLFLRILKIIDFGYAHIIYFSLAFVFMMLLNVIVFGKNFSEERERKKKTMQLIMEVLINTWLSGIGSYLARHVFLVLHYPLQGLYDYDTTKLREITNGAPFSIFLSAFDSRLRLQMRILGERFGFA